MAVWNVFLIVGIILNKKSFYLENKQYILFIPFNGLTSFITYFAVDGNMLVN